MATIQGVYIALFGRPADPDGLTFWQEKTGDGGDLAYLVGRLTWMPEYTFRFDGLSSGEIVNAVYQTLFNRKADPEGLAFFADALDSGRQTIETIAINILDGARGADATVLAHKLTAAGHFTTAIDLAGEAHAYADDRATDAARAFIAGVTDDAGSIPTIGEAQTYLDALLRGLEAVPVFTLAENAFGAETIDTRAIVDAAQAADENGPPADSLRHADGGLFATDPEAGDLRLVTTPDLDAPREADAGAAQPAPLAVTDADDNTDVTGVSAGGPSDMDII